MATIYDVNGKEAGKLKLPKAMFDAKINEDLMHRSVIMRLANARNPIAHTKTRGEIKATTKKAFRQKGTGNARRGAMSTNLLRGGGVTHGPRNTRNFTKQMPKKERRLALFSSLTVRAKENAICGLSGISTDKPNTKVAAGAIKNMPEAKRYLFVLEKGDTAAQKSLRNIPNTKTVWASYLNPYDVLLCDKICFVGDALSQAEKTFITTK